MSQLGQLISVTLGVTSLTGDSGGALSGALKIKGGSNITTAAAGTDITVNVSGTTNHAIQLGNVGGSLSSLAVGATGTVLTGVTGADPAFSATPTVTTIYATTFDTNVAAAGVTLAGTTLSADGTDVDININITAKGTGKVVINELQLTTDLAVTEGGTGASTLLDHGLLVGSGTAAVDALAVGSTGTILTGVTGADPTWTTATYPSTVVKGDVLVASANNVIGVVNDVVNSGYVLTANAAAAPTFRVLPTPVVASFASDPETIAGTVANKAVAPSNLKAKLGTQTIHALPIGASDSAALGWLAVGTTGKYLRAATTADPGWSTLTLPNTVTKGDVLVASADNVVDIVAGATTAGYVLMANGALTAPTFQALPAAGIVSVSGTANQITASTLLGAVTLSTPNTFIAPGTIASTTTNTAGTDLISTAGNLKLPASSSTVGQIQIANNTVFHTYGGEPGNDAFRNLWIGKDAGNFTCSTATNFGANIGIGCLAMRSLTGGQENFALGYKSLNALTGATNSGYRNVAIGNYSLYRLVGGTNTPEEGSYNTAIGYGAGGNYTGNEYGNILINYAGVAGQNNRLQIGASTGTGAGAGIINTAYICGIYGRTPVGTLNIALIDSNNQLGSVASLAVPQGGTGTATFTDHGVIYGQAAAAFGVTAEGATGTVLIGTTGNAPSFSASPTVTTMNATTFDTNVAAAKLQMAGTTITATGSGTDVGMTVTPKGAGNLTLTTGYVVLSSGNLALPATSATVGQVTINAVRVLHTYGTDNTFVGTNAGSLTLTVANATLNTGIGVNSLLRLVGTNATEATQNCACGKDAGAYVTSGSYNSFFGMDSGNATTTGSSNICIGAESNTSGATASNELVIGAGTGTGARQINVCSISGITGKTSTSGAAVYVNSSNVLGTATSSIRYKEDVTDMSDMSQICAKLRPVTFHFKEDTEPKPLQYGLIAEEVEQVWPEMVIYGPDGLPQNLSYNFLAPILVSEVQRLNKVISDLSSKVTSLTRTADDLTNRIIALENK